VAEGKTNGEIASALVISENTVKIHVRNILEKLHLQNRIQAAVYAVRQGLVDDNPS
jgi:two-component system nitrate/nitrite response regulator NarL